MRDFCFLRPALRKKAYWRKQGQHSGQPDDLWRFFQMNHLTSASLMTTYVLGLKVLGLGLLYHAYDPTPVTAFLINLRQLSQHGARLGLDVRAGILRRQRHQDAAHAAIGLHWFDQPQRLNTHA